MFIVSIHKGLTVKVVHVSGIRGEVSNDLVAGFAMQAAGESPDRLFDWTVEPYGSPMSGATVYLYTN